MTSEQALRVADLTLEVGLRGDDRHAIRFRGPCSQSIAYYEQPVSMSLDVTLAALRAQLALSVEGWDVIQGGKHVADGDMVGRLFRGFTKFNRLARAEEVPLADT